MADRPDGLLTTRDVQERLGVSRQRVHQLVRKGKLPSAHASRSRADPRLFSPQALEAFLARRQQREAEKGPGLFAADPYWCARR